MTIGGLPGSIRTEVSMTQRTMTRNQLQVVIVMPVLLLDDVSPKTGCYTCGDWPNRARDVIPGLRIHIEESHPSPPLQSWCVLSLVHASWPLSLPSLSLRSHCNGIENPPVSVK